MNVPGKVNLRIAALLKRAVAAQQANDFVQAEKLYREILILEPNHADSHHFLGVMAKQLGRSDIAIKMIGQAIKLNPHVAAYYNNLGLAFQSQRDLDKAILLFEHAVKLQPDDPDFNSNLAGALNETGDPTRALKLYEKIIDKKNPNFCNAYGVTLMQLGRRDEAKNWFEQAITLQPDHADAHANLLCWYLQQGDFARGWAAAEWRWRITGVAAHSVPGPLWDGGDLNGKTILLHCEQGAGDNIQFVRYAPLVKAKGGKVILSCPSSLAPLFATVDGIDQIAPETTGQDPNFTYDCQAPLMSLPRLLNTTLDTVPAATPYLNVDPAKAAAWHERLKNISGKKIGVVWRGNPAHLNDRNRSIPAALFAQCLPDNIQVINLQKDATADELKKFSSQKLFNAAPFLQDYSDTAALITMLDLILTVDTSICHLSGALGIPTWLLLPFASDWRWLLDRADSPWYPGIRLFRQPQPGDWRAVAERVKTEISAAYSSPPFA